MEKNLAGRGENEHMDQRKKGGAQKKKKPGKSLPKVPEVRLKQIKKQKKIPEELQHLPQWVPYGRLFILPAKLCQKSGNFPFFAGDYIVAIILTKFPIDVPIGGKKIKKVVKIIGGKGQDKKKTKKT